MQKADQLSDQELIERIQNSDVRAFKSLYFRYYKRLGNYIFIRINSNEQTKDVLQEIFAWLWQNRKTLKIKTSLIGYLYRMAYNITVNIYKKKSLHRDYMTSLLSHPNTTSSNIIDIQIDIKTIISHLPEKQQNVFILSRYEGLQNSEIAEILNISVKTVESRMTKVLKTLREILRTP